MENTNKSAVTAVKVANALKVISIVGVVFCRVGAICGFALNGFINEYYPSSTIKFIFCISG